MISKLAIYAVKYTPFDVALIIYVRTRSILLCKTNTFISDSRTSGGLHSNHYPLSRRLQPSFSGKPSWVTAISDSQSINRLHRDGTTDAGGCEARIMQLSPIENSGEDVVVY